VVNTIGHAPVQEIDLQKAQPNWQARLYATPTIEREAFGARSSLFSSSRFRNFEITTLLLVGGKTTPFYKAATEALQTIPCSRVVVLPEQGHEGVVTSPQLFLRHVVSFLQLPSLH
jgi:pimeloyl-ACP methyl ester carboxylesterase